MSRDLPVAFSSSSESAVTPSPNVSRSGKSRHLSVLPGANQGDGSRMTRGQVAKRLGISVSSVRRHEGERLHPTVDDKDVRWFEEKEDRTPRSRV
jgi:hypothetical protein